MASSGVLSRVACSHLLCLFSDRVSLDLCRPPEKRQLSKLNAMPSVFVISSSTFSMLEGTVLEVALAPSSGVPPGVAASPVTL